MKTLVLLLITLLAASANATFVCKSSDGNLLLSERGFTLIESNIEDGGMELSHLRARFVKETLEQGATLKYISERNGAHIGDITIDLVKNIKLIKSGSVGCIMSRGVRQYSTTKFNMSARVSLLGQQAVTKIFDCTQTQNMSSCVHAE